MEWAPENSWQTTYHCTVNLFSKGLCYLIFEFIVKTLTWLKTFNSYLEVLKDCWNQSRWQGLRLEAIANAGNVLGVVTMSGGQSWRVLWQPTWPCSGCWGCPETKLSMLSRKRQLRVLRQVRKLWHSSAEWRSFGCFLLATRCWNIIASLIELSLWHIFNEPNMYAFRWGTSLRFPWVRRRRNLSTIDDRNTSFDLVWRCMKNILHNSCCLYSVDALINSLGPLRLARPLLQAVHEGLANKKVKKFSVK